MAESAYDSLLTATIEHLEGLKSKGAQHVMVDPGILKDLGIAVRRPSLPIKSEVTKTPESVSSANRAITVTETFHSATVAVTEPSLAPATTALDKDAAMAELRGRALVCVKCPNLVSSRKNIVFGVGDIHTDLMFVGEAPGADEDVQGEPFVGKAGQLLTKIIQTMGYSRQSVYIANVLKCRPDTPGQAMGNRKPTPDEMKTCLPYLLAQIDIIKPKAIVALGGTAVEGLFGKPIGIMKLRGSWQTFRGIPVMPTYHPAYLLRNQALSEKRKVWEDMLQVLEKLGRPISEKQRAYFLKAG